MAGTIKRLPAMRKTRIRFLGRESALEKEMAIHSSTLAWKIPWREEPDRLQSMGSQSRTRLTDFTSLHFSSVARLCQTHCEPMNHSTPGLPVHHQHPEFTQTHIHRVSDAIQPSHPRSSPSPPVPNPSQHQSFPMSQLFP